MLSVNNNYYRLIPVLFLLLFPLSSTLLPSVHGIVNLSSTFIGLFLYSRFKSSMDAPYISQESWLFYGSVVFIVFVAFAVTSISGIDQLALKKLSKFFYLLLVIPVYFFFRYFSINHACFWYGLFVGAVLSACGALYDSYVYYPIRAHGITHPIIFGDLALLMGAMSVAGMGWFKLKGRLFVIIPIVAAVMGLLASFLSQSRGGWISIPVIVLILLWFFSAQVPRWKLGVGLVMLVISLVVIYQLPQTGVERRVAITFNELSEYFSTDTSHMSHETAIGSRFEMWQASLQIFRDNPLIGVGWGHYQENAQILVEKGLRHKTVGDWVHPHNQFLSSMVAGGVIGLIATLALFAIPALIFIRVIRSHDRSNDAHRFALAGLIMIVGFAVFNLSESFLERSRTVGFFVFYLAVCMAGIHEKENILINYNEKTT